MAIIKITAFGGLRPKDSARALPVDGAQVASNLLAVVSEFRPLATDTTVVASSGVSNPKTIYRLQRTSSGALNTNFSSAANWKISAIEKSYVKGQLNDDATERTYVTFNDASQAPRVIDATGQDRQLGVPAPTNAPSVTVNVVDEFTPEDRAADLSAALATAIQYVKDSALTVWRGATAPGTSTSGYLDRSPANGFDPGYPGHQLRAYRLGSTGGAISNSYCSVAATEFSWVFDPLLGGFSGTLGASPSWGGSAAHWFIPFDAYGVTKDIDTVALTASLGAMLMPGMTDGTKLFTPAQVAEIVAALVALASPTGAVKPRLDALASKVTEIKQLLDGSSRSSLSATVQAFYSKTDVAAEITAAIDNFANNVFQYADLVARSSLPADYLGGAGDAGGPA